MRWLSVLVLLVIVSGIGGSWATALPTSKHIQADATESSTQPPETTKPNEAMDKAPTQPNSKADYSKEPFVIEQLRLRYQFENDGTGHREQTMRIRVQSESGVQQWGQLRFGYNSFSERLDIPYVRVIKPDGSVVTAGADAVQELNEPIQRIAPTYTDFREKHVTVPGLRPSDILEAQTVTVIHTPMAPGQFWVSHDFQKSAITLDEQLEIDVPAARSVKLETKPGIDPKTTEENGRRIYHWSSSHLSREEEKAAGAQKEKKKRKPQEEFPAVQLTSFASWEEVGKWYGTLEKDRRAPSTAVRAKAEELTKGLHTDAEKIEALYTYTAQNFRYVSLSLGMGRYQPHSADEVLRNQYGDCKDKNTLLASLLDAAGFHSATVLINATRKLDPDVPSPVQFNHAITMVPVGKDELWMDTTTEVAPFRLLSYSLRKKLALVIPPDGVPRLEETPADSPVPDTERLDIDGKVDDAGKLDAKIAYEIRGDSEIVLRQLFRNVASVKWQQVVEGINLKEGMGKEVSEVKVSDPTATRESFKFSYHMVKANYVDTAKKKVDMKLPLPIFGLTTAEAADADGPETIKLGPKNTRDYHFKIALPSKYAVQVPLASALKRDYGTYESTYKLEGHFVTAGRKLEITEQELPSSRVEDYLAFRRGVLADLLQQIALETSVASKPDFSADMKPEELIRRGNEARKAGDYGVAAEFLKRAVEAEPKSKAAWNNLGLVYMDSMQDDLAIVAFQKQIEINAYDPHAYNNLGQVYLHQHKYDEAMKWFSKQIEIDPLDKYAHRNMGIAYLEQHRYAEAVPELEKAVSLTPDNAEAHVRVGTAYLNLGQEEKAMTAFDKAVSLSTKPLTWNNIAYQLASKKSHLDVARRYAESSVTSTEAALRTLSLDQLGARDLGLTAMLANSWDTLGWVEFADGNLDKAQQYLLAAWQLSQHTDAADHLAQIYEKRGDKQDAARFYALAMNARRPEPETRSRLAALGGENDKVDSIIEKNRDEYSRAGTIKVNNASNLEGKAEFFVLLSAGPSAQVSVESTKFISGDEKLRNSGEALRTAHFVQTNPHDTVVKLLHRGTLSCTASSDCVFVQALPEDVKAVD